jgi:hypothetical protein
MSMQRNILELIATRFHVPPTLRALQELQSDEKRAVKISLAELFTSNGITDGEINAYGVAIDNSSIYARRSGW